MCIVWRERWNKQVGVPSQCYLYGRWQELSIYFMWQELSRYQVYFYVASETRNEEVKSYAVSQTSNFSIWLQEKINLCVTTRIVNLPSLPNLCMMTRTVNLPSVFICAQQRIQVICGQWPSQVKCSYPNQQWNNLLTRSFIKMTRTVNLPTICVMTRKVKWDLKGHHLHLCHQCQRLLATRLGHSLK